MARRHAQLVEDIAAAPSHIVETLAADSDEILRYEGQLPKGLLITVSGSVTVTLYNRQKQEASHTLELFQGYHPIRPVKVTATTATGLILW